MIKPKWSATKIFTFASAHMLTGHNGLCANLHGHNYKVEVTFESSDTLIPEGSSEGMVCDFKRIKEICNTAVFDEYDHALIINSEALESGNAEDQLWNWADENTMKCVLLDSRPTAEIMAETFYGEINDALFLNLGCMVKCSKVKVWETDSSFAEYEEVSTC